MFGVVQISLLRSAFFVFGAFAGECQNVASKISVYENNS